MGIIIFILLLPVIIGLGGIILPLLLAIITLPLQLLGFAAEEAKAAEAKK